MHFPTEEEEEEEELLEHEEDKEEKGSKTAASDGDKKADDREVECTTDRRRKVAGRPGDGKRGQQQRHFRVTEEEDTEKESGAEGVISEFPSVQQKEEEEGGNVVGASSVALAESSCTRPLAQDLVSQEPRLESGGGATDTLRNTSPKTTTTDKELEVVHTQQPKRLVDTCVVLHQDNSTSNNNYSFLRNLFPSPTPHLVAILYSCPVITLCNLVGMISARCKSHSEVFADRLQAKLNLIGPSSNSQQQQQQLPEHTDRMMAIKASATFPYPGTTFPPSRCGQHFEQMRHSHHFRSEPDLTPAAANGHHHHFGDDDEEDDIMASKLRTAVRNKNGNNNGNDDDGNDSDLFFDFDIGSPEVEEEDKTSHDSQIRPRAGSDESFDNSTKNSVAFGSTSSGLCSDFHSVNTFNGEDEQELEHVLQDVAPEMALDPRDWLAKRSFKFEMGSPAGSNTSSSTPIATQSPNEGASSPLISPDSLLDEPVTSSSAATDSNNSGMTTEVKDEQRENANIDSNELSGQEKEVVATDASTIQPVSSSSDQNKESGVKSHEVDIINSSANDKTSESSRKNEVKESSSSSSEGASADSFSIYTGSQKHTVASSKLNALIALLEKDREYTKSQRSPPTSPTKKSSNNSSSVEEVINPGKSSPTKRSYKCPLPTIADSPANFSFLSEKASSSANIKGEAAKISGSYAGHQREHVSVMPRSDSTPVLTFTEREFMQSPQINRKGINIKLAQQQQQQQMEEDAKAEGAEKKNNLLHVEDEEDAHPKLRRASSLKSGKTPPGTPSRHKIVRFADVFGLDLADVKTFFDEIPKVPKSAYKDLTEADLSDLDSEAGSEASNRSYGSSTFDFMGKGFPKRKSSNSSVPQALPSMQLVPMFSQPGGFPNFFDLLRDKKICLEEAFMLDPSSIRGTVRVQNVGFHKRVCLLHTTNEWLTQGELEATYIQGSCDGFSDKFNFVLRLSRPMSIGQRLQFCLRYEVNGDKHWDNNMGKNYVFQCLGGAPPSQVASSSSSSQSSKQSSPSPNSSAARPVPQITQASFGSSYSHSPSAMAEDPWLRYL